MPLHIRIVLLSALASLGLAQTKVNLGSQSTGVDFSQMSAIKPVKVVTTLASICMEREFVFRLEAGSVGRLFACSSNSLWVLQSMPASSGAPIGAILTNDGNRGRMGWF